MNEKREFYNSAVQPEYMNLKKDLSGSVTRALRTYLYSFFFPRYIILAFIFAYLFFDSIEFMRAIETQILTDMLQFFSFEVPPMIDQPVIPQILFLIFFPTFAFGSRINLKMRAKFLAFGIIGFLLFILIQFFTITVTNTFLTLNLDNASLSALNIFFTTIIGGLLIELSLFSNMNIPNSPEIKRIIKRRYYREYTYLAVVILGSLLILFLLLVQLLQIGFNSPVAILVFFYLNIMSLSSFAYYFSYLLYQTRPLDRATTSLLHENYNSNNSNSITFLIAAYNEQELIEDCVTSIDKACSKYGKGTHEIIIVDDGSTDRTAEIVARAFQHLKCCTGKLYTISNSGKAVALNYGLPKASGDIVFRIDADTTIEEDAIEPLINHFKDPQVASVSGMFNPVNLTGHWQRTVSLYHFLFTYNKRAQALIDSIIVQPGAFSVFRKDALVKIEGWASNQFGEDGEVTNRLSRYGFKAAYEPSSIAHNDVRSTLKGILRQRARWAVAFYFSRGSHLSIAREFGQPKWIVFLFNLLEHGLALVGSLMIPFLIAAILTGVIEFSVSSVPFIFLSGLGLILLIVYVIQLAFLTYNILKFRKPGYYILYFPMMKILMFILLTYVKPQVTEIVLSWSSKWSEYTDEAYEELRKEVRKSIDPQH
jgi:cellulose synthase/poly-beta-1,6-N-acetylglucosamine synthase-like glycosyltransferase